MSDVVLDFASNTRLARVVQLSTCVLGLYDHVLTLDQEYELIWKKRWSTTKFLFLWIRYLGNALLLATTVVFLMPQKSNKNVTYDGLRSFNSCSVWVPLQAWISTAVGWTFQVCLIIRIHALYNRPRWMTVFLSVYFVIEIVSTSVLVGMSFRHVQVVSEPISGSYFCASVNTPGFYPLFWIIGIVFDFILAVFAGWKGFNEWMRASGSRNGGLLLRVLVRDSFMWFFLTLSLYIIDAVVVYRAPQDIVVPGSFTFGLAVITGSRMILNVRNVYYMPFAEPSTDEDPLSAMRGICPDYFAREMDQQLNTNQSTTLGDGRDNDYSDEQLQVESRINRDPEIRWDIDVEDGKIQICDEETNRDSGVEHVGEKDLQ